MQVNVLNFVDEEADINLVNDYFSYEHFYVLYCKFWELDTDHVSMHMTHGRMYMHQCIYTHMEH